MRTIFNIHVENCALSKLATCARHVILTSSLPDESHGPERYDSLGMLEEVSRTVTNQYPHMERTAHYRSGSDN